MRVDVRVGLIPDLAYFPRWRRDKLHQTFYQVFGHGTKPGCKSKMILEMFDCINDPLFAMGGQLEHTKRFKKQCEVRAPYMYLLVRTPGCKSDGR